LRSNKIVRRISDHICLENGLSVIENPKHSRGHYGSWLGGDKEPTYRETLRAVIDETLTQKPSDFDAFIKLLEAQSCEFNRKRMSIKMPNRKGFIRLRSLGDGFPRLLFVRKYPVNVLLPRRASRINSAC